MKTLEAINIKDNEKFLRQVSEPIDFEKDNINEYIELLDRYFEAEDMVLAMAAVQLGIPKRLIYLKNTDLSLVERKQQEVETEEDKLHNERRILINPVITAKEGLTDYWEACASCIEYTGHVKRPYRIKLEYYDVLGNKHEEVFEGFESTVLSHEMDHLDGILHMDIADEVIEMTIEERKVFRTTHGYNIVSKTGDFDELKKGEGYGRIKK